MKPQALGIGQASFARSLYIMGLSVKDAAAKLGQSAANLYTRLEQGFASTESARLPLAYASCVLDELSAPDHRLFPPGTATYRFAVNKFQSTGEFRAGIRDLERLVEVNDKHVKNADAATYAEALLARAVSYWLLGRAITLFERRYGSASPDDECSNAAPLLHHEVRSLRNDVLKYANLARQDALALSDHEQFRDVGLVLLGIAIRAVSSATFAIEILPIQCDTGSTWEKLGADERKRLNGVASCLLESLREAENAFVNSKMTDSQKARLLRALTLDKLEIAMYSSSMQDGQEAIEKFSELIATGGCSAYRVVQLLPFGIDTPARVLLEKRVAWRALQVLLSSSEPSLKQALSDIKQDPSVFSDWVIQFRLSKEDPNLTWESFRKAQNADDFQLPDISKSLV
ncbi:MAG: hypothetical protein O9327_02310 [Polaromonas sp.]|nr:hypothetical protein [Polaromonas sp.]